MTFINTMINAREYLEERVAVRREFVDLGLLQVLQKLRLWIDNKRAVDERTESLTKLSSQFDVFQEAMLFDQRETTRGNLDLSYVLFCFIFFSN